MKVEIINYQYEKGLYSEICLNRSINKTEPCKNQTLNKVPK